MLRKRRVGVDKYLRDLHVMTQFEVRTECESLGHGDVTPGLEHHHGDRTTGESVSDDQFGDDTRGKEKMLREVDVEDTRWRMGSVLQADLLIGDSLDHTNGDGERE